MTATIQYQNYLRSCVAYWLNGQLFQTISYNVVGHVAQVLNINYYWEG